MRGGGPAYGRVMTSLPAPRTLAGPDATATIHDQGAHLVSWTPAGHEPVLWCSARTRLERGVAIRGGVPICLPWFGSGRTGDRTPSHGPARLTAWRVVDEGDGEITYETTGAELGLADTLQARYRVVAGQTLRLTLTVTNTGDDELTYEEALHTYLAVGDVREASLDGLDGASYVDKVDHGRVHRQQGPVRFTRETDRIYRSAAPLTLTDPVGGRRLRVTTAGAASAVVWNPWVDKTAALTDMGDDEWTGMLCVEAGNVGDDALTLAPGDAHTVSYELAVLDSV